MSKVKNMIILFVLAVLIVPLCANPAAASAGKNEYLVVYQPGIDPDIASSNIAALYSAEVLSVYHHALRGSFIRASAAQVEKIRLDPTVTYVEENQQWEVDAQISSTGLERIFASTNPNLYINEQHDYVVDVDVAVLDTGIDLDHPDLNVVSAIDCTLSGPYEGTCDGVKDDGNGHGSHVAGIIGALDNNFGVVGVAPGARLWAVKVLTNYGTGTTAQIVAGIDWVADHANDIEIANMSLGGTGESIAMDDAITNAVAAGVTFVLSAGNRAIDVNDYHPAGVPTAITVSALADFDGLPGSLSAPTCYDDIDDTLANFSNFGEGVDITAPGVCIYSTYMDGGYATGSGTSQAAPFVAGAAALLASTGVYASPAEIKAQLLATGNYNWIDDAPDGIQEPLLDVSDTDVFAPLMLSTDRPITLSGVGYRVAAYQFTDLTWSGATTTVDIYRDGIFIINTENDGFHTDAVGIKGRGTHTYRLCDANSTTHCSETITVQY